jgi:hypothetical protein
MFDLKGKHEHVFLSILNKYILFNNATQYARSLSRGNGYLKLLP